MIFAFIKSFLKNILPNGRVKNILIYFNHLIHTGDCKIRYSFKERAYVVTFAHSILSPCSIIFPAIDFQTISGIPRETPPYFSTDYIKEGSVVIDAGAFPGDFTILAAQLVGKTGKVIALEPSLENRAYLKKVLVRNGLMDRVELLGVALSDDNSGVLFNSDTIFSHVVDNAAGGLSSDNRVDSITLDELLRTRGLLSVSGKNIVVKMDIEGAELDAFRGSTQSLQDGVKFIIAAYHIVNGVRTAETLEKWFENIGYNTVLKNPTHFTLFAEK